MTRLNGWQLVTVLGMIFMTIIVLAIMKVDLTAMLALAAMIIGGGAFAAAQGAKENSNGTNTRLLGLTSAMAEAVEKMAHRMGDAPALPPLEKEPATDAWRPGLTDTTP